MWFFFPVHIWHEMIYNWLFSHLTLWFLRFATSLSLSLLPVMWIVRAAGWRLDDTLQGANVSSVTSSGGFGFRWGSEDGPGQRAAAASLHRRPSLGAEAARVSWTMRPKHPPFPGRRETCSLTALLSWTVCCCLVTLIHSRLDSLTSCWIMSQTGAF